MKARLLGSGTSSGVPRIGNVWGACDPDEPKNSRTRASLLLEASNGFRILIDTGPDMRAQMLRAEVDCVDAVIWTHTHADHCHGIDDIRQFYFQTGKPIDGYASASTRSDLESRFGYIFSGNGGYPPLCRLGALENGSKIGPFDVRSCEQPHAGAMTSSGLRFDCDGFSVGYAIDFKEITAEMLDLYADCDLLFVDCVRREPHPTHAHVALAHDLAMRAGVDRAIATHMDHSMDYRTLQSEFEPPLEPGYDQMVLELT